MWEGVDDLDVVFLEEEDDTNVVLERYNV